MNIGVQDGKAKGIEWVQAEYDRLKEDLNRDPSYYNVISIALSELQQEQEQVGREQKQVEHIDGFIDVVQSVFSALFPEEVYGKLLGLSEYEDKRQDFYKLIHATYAEQQKPIFEAHNLEIAAKDEKIQALTKQGLEVQGQLDEAKHELEEYKEHNQTLSDDISERNVSIAEYSVKLERANTEIKLRDGLLAKSHEKITELEEKLEQATKPKEPVSGNLQSLINDVKIRSKRDVPTDEWIKRFEDRQANGGKVMSIDLPSIGGGAIGETFPNADQTNDATNKVDVSDEVDQFRPDESIPEIQQGAESGNSGDTAAPVGTLEEAFRRIGALERQVFRPAETGAA